MPERLIFPPPCIKDGVPPCPTCPVYKKCKWAGHVLEDDDKVVQKKIAICKHDS